MSVKKPAPPIQPPRAAGWHEVEAAFEAALALQGQARNDFLNNLDDEIGDEVHRLLAADKNAGENFLRPARENLVEMPAAVGPYPVEQEIGRGGMGVVYLGRDPNLARPVAIKCLHNDLDIDTGALRRMEREAKVLASLSHPNVATIYSLEKESSASFLVLEYVPGINLSEKLRHGPLPLRECLRIGSQIASALSAAHERGVIHRDLKPANIRLTPEGHLKVLDFGLAKPFQPMADEATGLTRSGTILGTVSYMSPEQALGQELGPRSDIWSLGCVLFECLSGQRPFQGDTPWQTLDAITRAEPRWDVLPDNLPRPALRLLRRCLRHDPAERLRDAADIALELEDLLAEDSSPLPQLTRTSRHRPPNRVWLAFVASFLSLALGLVLGHWALPRSPPRPSFNLAVALPEQTRNQSESGRSSFALSPDGQHLAFVGIQGIWVRSLKTGKEQWLPETRAAQDPFFAPDGRSIGYTRNQHLFKITIPDGAPIRLAELPAVGAGASWGDDGAIVFAPYWQGGLWRLPVAGEPEEITRPNADESELSHRWPHVLPGSQGVLYTVKTDNILSFDDAPIYVLDRRDGRSRRLVTGGTHPRYVETPETGGVLLYGRANEIHGVPFDLHQLKVTGEPRRIFPDVDVDPIVGTVTAQATLDGRTFAAVDARDRPSRDVNLIWMDPSGETAPAIGPEDQRWYIDARLSPDGRLLALPAIAANNPIWIYDLERGTLQRLHPEFGNLQRPAWHPDSQRIAALSEKQGQKELLLLGLDGGEAEVLHRAEFLATVDSWLPDGSGLFVTLRMGNNADIWFVPIQGEARPYLDSQDTEVNPSVSPNGRWLAYSVQGHDIYALLLSGVAGGPTVQVARAAGGPIWAPDGRRLFFTSNRRLMSVPIREPSPGEALPRIGTPEELFTIGQDAAVTAFDGQRFLVRAPAKPLPSPGQARIILGWDQRLIAAFGRDSP